MGFQPAQIRHGEHWTWPMKDRMLPALDIVTAASPSVSPQYRHCVRFVTAA